jgi:predicted HTH domain antitoxin
MKVGIPEKLIEQIVQKNCVVFVGAGLSMSVGLPGWPQLLRRMIEWCESHGVSLPNKGDIEEIINKNDLPLAADALRDRMGDDKYREFMEEVFLRPDLKPTKAHLLLAQIPFAGAATTNYDGLVESGYREIHPGEPFEVFTQVEHEQLSRALRDKKYFVLKAHGTIERFNTIVLGENDYNRLIHESLGYRTFLRALFTSRTVLFIGFGLTDSELLLLLKELRTIFKEPTIPHYALADVTKMTATEQELFTKNTGVHIIPYKPATNEHPEVKSFLTELFRQVTRSAVWYQAEEAEKAIKDDDPNYRVVATSKKELYVEEKYAGAAEKFPLKTSVKLKFDKTTPEGREGHEAMKRKLATGEPVTIKGAHIVDVEIPELIRRYMPDVVQHLEISMGVTRRAGKPLPVKVTIHCEDGETATLDNILLENVQSGSEQAIFSNEKQDVPWKFKLVIKLKEDVSDFTFTLADDVGLPVKQALDGLRFQHILSKGGVLRIESLNTGSQLLHGQIAPGTSPALDPRLIEVLDALLLIQIKTGTAFTSPENISVEEANAIFSVVQVLKTGKIELSPEPSAGHLTIEQAKDTLDRFVAGATVQLMTYSDEWVSVIMGQKVELGPVLVTCERARITPEDLEVLRKDIEGTSPCEMVEFRLTPAPGVITEAKFLNWLPADEAERIRNMPFVRMTALKSLIALLFETAKPGPASLDIDQFIDLLTEARSQRSADGSPLNPLSSATPEELLNVMLPMAEWLGEAVGSEARFEFAAKLFDREWLSSGKAARLAGVDRVSFLTNLHTVGIAVLDLDEEEMENQARYVNIE